MGTTSSKCRNLIFFGQVLLSTLCLSAVLHSNRVIYIDGAASTSSSSASSSSSTAAVPIVSSSPTPVTNSSRYGGTKLNLNDKRCGGSVANIFVVAGQSNAWGFGDPAQTGGLWIWDYWRSQGFGFNYWLADSWRSQTQWKAGSEFYFRTDIVHPTTGARTFGPDLALMGGLQAAGWKNVYMYKAAFSASSLAWNSSANSNHWLKRGQGGYTDLMIADLKNAADLLCAQGLRPVIQGIFWMQGESDALLSYEHANQYATNLAGFIDELRSEITTSDTPFVIGKIRPNSYWTYGDMLRTRQDIVAYNRAHVYTVETSDLSVWANDTAHFDTNGQIALGWRFFEKFNTIRGPGDEINSANNLPFLISGRHPDASQDAVWQLWANNTEILAAPDNYAYIRSNAAGSNHNNTLSDVTVYSPDRKISFTASTALAGAIASVKYLGQELIHATHGAAFQYHVRYDPQGMCEVKGNTCAMLMNECDNPTEAGNHDNAAGFPIHNASSSYIEALGSDRVGGFERLWSRNSPVDYTAPGKTSDDYGNGTCTNNKSAWFSGFKIHKWVAAGWKSPLDQKTHNNIIYMQSQLDIPAAYRNYVIQYELIAYLRRWAINEYQYDAVLDKLTAQPSGVPTLGGESGVAKIFANVDNTFAFGFLAFHQKGAPIVRDDSKTAGIFEAYNQQPAMYSSIKASGKYPARFVQADWYFRNTGASIMTHTFIALGSLEEVKATLREVAKAAEKVPSQGFDFKSRSN